MTKTGTAEVSARLEVKNRLVTFIVGQFLLGQLKTILHDNFLFLFVYHQTFEKHQLLKEFRYRILLKSSLQYFRFQAISID